MNVYGVYVPPQLNEGPVRDKASNKRSNILLIAVSRTVSLY